MSTYFDKSKNLRDLADDIANHLERTGYGHDVSNEPRVPKGSGEISGEWTRGNGGTQVALSLGNRILAVPLRGAIEKRLNKLTNGALTPRQMGKLIDQIIDNLPDKDLGELKNIPDAMPIEITPDQRAIIQGQIDKLTPDIRGAVQEQFDRAIENGTVVCPGCNG